MEMQRKRQDHFPGMSGIDSSYWSLTNIFYEFPVDLIIITWGDQTSYNLTQTILAKAHAYCCLSASGNI